MASDSWHRKNQWASDWMHRGIDLLNENSALSIDQAVRCFDQAIALRRTLPLDEIPFLRYGLSAGWINRGDALARLERREAGVDAIKSYDEALVLLKSLPLEENVLYPRRLAITWLNRGIALQKQETPVGLEEATECFLEALQILNHPLAAAIVDRDALLAGAWTNLAGALVNSGVAAPEEARTAARRALALTKALEQSDRALAEIALKARRVLCVLVIKEMTDNKTIPASIVAEATDAADEALALIRHGQLQGRADERALTRDFFRFGCRIYAHHQPHFLAEFLLEYLDPDKAGIFLSFDLETVAAAQAAIWSALAHYQSDGFCQVATPRFGSLLDDIQKLREVEERLQRLRFTSLDEAEAQQHK